MLTVGALVGLLVVGLELVLGADGCEWVAVLVALDGLALGFALLVALGLDPAVTMGSCPTFVPAEEITPQVRVEAPATVRSQTNAIIKGRRLLTDQ